MLQSSCLQEIQRDSGWSDTQSPAAFSCSGVEFNQRQENDGIQLLSVLFIQIMAMLQQREASCRGGGCIHPSTPHPTCDSRGVLDGPDDSWLIRECETWAKTWMCVLYSQTFWFYLIKIASCVKATGNRAFYIQCFLSLAVLVCIYLFRNVGGGPAAY